MTGTLTEPNTHPHTQIPVHTVQTDQWPVSQESEH